MTDDRVAAITALLLQTEEAHGAYERIELGGVYDQDWPRWYAAYAVEHGIGALVGHDVTEADLATFLATSYDDFRRMEPVPAVPWAAYLARRVTAEL
jgi:hypothetical protein